MNTESYLEKFCWLLLKLHILAAIGLNFMNHLFAHHSKLYKSS